MAELSISTITNNTARPLSRGEEGLAIILNLQNEAMDKVYPNWRVHQDRLITKISQIKFTRDEDLEKMQRNVAEDKILYRAFLALGVYQSTLKNYFYGNSDTFFSFVSSPPLLHFSRSLGSKLEDTNPLKRVETAISITARVLNVNLNLLPDPVEMGVVSRFAVRLGRMDLYDDIKLIILKSGAKLEETDLDFIENLMYSLIYSEGDYHPRAAFYGGCIPLMLPNQNLDSAECIGQRDFHSFVYQFLSIPVINELFKLVINEGLVRGKMPLEVSFETKTKANKGRIMLEELGIVDYNEVFKLYTSSKLAKIKMDKDCTLVGSPII